MNRRTPIAAWTLLLVAFSAALLVGSARPAAAQDPTLTLYLPGVASGAIGRPAGNPAHRNPDPPAPVPPTPMILEDAPASGIIVDCGGATIDGGPGTVNYTPASARVMIEIRA